MAANAGRVVPPAGLGARRRVSVDRLDALWLHARGRNHGRGGSARRYPVSGQAGCGAGAPVGHAGRGPAHCFATAVRAEPARGSRYRRRTAPPGAGAVHRRDREYGRRHVAHCWAGDAGVGAGRRRGARPARRGRPGHYPGLLRWQRPPGGSPGDHHVYGPGDPSHRHAYIDARARDRTPRSGAPSAASSHPDARYQPQYPNTCGSPADPDADAYRRAHNHGHTDYDRHADDHHHAHHCRASGRLQRLDPGEDGCVVAHQRPGCIDHG